MCDVNDLSTNWYDILRNKDFYNSKQIELAKSHIAFDFMNLIDDDKMYELDFDTFVEILKLDDLNVYNEDLVFKAANEWIKRRHSNPEFKKIFEAVRMALISSEYLLDEIYPLTLTYLVDSKQFVEALKYHLLPNQRSIVSEYQKKPRKIFRKLLSAAGINSESSSTVELFDYATNTWTLLKNFDLKKTNAGAGIINNNLMIIGGFNNTPLVTVHTIDLKSGRISTAASLKTKRYNIGVTVTGTGNSAVIYAIGGLDGVDFLDSVEKWDPVTRNWSYIAPMKFKREYPGVAVMNNKIYVIGEKSDGIHNPMEMYDPISNTWEIKASLNQPRTFCMLTTAGNYIYAAGGYPGGYGKNGMNIVERYDPIENIWTTIASISAVGIVGLCSLGNIVICAGGQNQNNNVEEYDPDTKIWKKLAPLNHGREGGVIIEIPRDLLSCKFDWH